jgi:hypothetical protein
VVVGGQNNRDPVYGPDIKIMASSYRPKFGDWDSTQCANGCVQIGYVHTCSQLTDETHYRISH